MRRRQALQIITGAIVLAPASIAAQPAAKTYRIGTLTVGSPIPPTEGTGKMLVEGLAKRGYRLGENLAYEARGAAGKIPQMPNLMQELKAANVDAVVTIGYPSAAVAKLSGVATVIASGSGDPVVTGLVQSFAHPGGNVTGIADDAAALSTKRLGLLKAVSPELRTRRARFRARRRHRTSARHLALSRHSRRRRSWLQPPDGASQPAARPYQLPRQSYHLSKVYGWQFKVSINASMSALGEKHTS